MFLCVCVFLGFILFFVLFFNVCVCWFFWLFFSFHVLIYLQTDRKFVRKHKRKEKISQNLWLLCQVERWRCKQTFTVTTITSNTNESLILMQHNLVAIFNSVFFFGLFIFLLFFFYSVVFFSSFFFIGYEIKIGLYYLCIYWVLLFC